MLTHASNQAGRDEELLDTARDCFRFVTTFFEPINISAVHIYHSALELSPLSSIVRQLYHHQRPTPFPRVLVGIQGSWDQCSTSHHHNEEFCDQFTWSPCGQRIALNYNGVMEIRDPFTSELFSTLRPTKPIHGCLHTLTYSPDGRSLAALSKTSFIIWDIQTGGVAKEAECSAGIECDSTDEVLLVWSLDGRAIAICTTTQEQSDPDYIVHVCTYDIDSGAPEARGTLLLPAIPHLWAHGESFRIMTTRWDGEAPHHTIDVSEVGPVLTKIESFCVGPSSSGGRAWIRSFSPTTYRIVVDSEDGDRFHIFDIRNWECLLEQEGGFALHCFSPDGSLFAARSYSGEVLQIWKYCSGHYTVWGRFPAPHDYTPIRFSPDSSSIAGWFPDLFRAWRLEHLPLAHPDGPSHKPPVALSYCGTYMATSHRSRTTVTITSLISQSPPQFIDTGDMFIVGLALTGNVLLVAGVMEIVAWRLTEEGVVVGPLGDRRANHSDSVWTIPGHANPSFSFQDQTVVVEWSKAGTLTYHTGTGEVLEPTPTPRHFPIHSTFRFALLGSHPPHYRELRAPSTHSGSDWPVSQTTFGEGWVKDLEGRHRLWIPPAWRASHTFAGWNCNIAALQFSNDRVGTVIVKF